MCQAAAATHVVQETDGCIMSYAVVLPITDLDHVMKEIKHHAMVVESIKKKRRQNNLYQNYIRAKRKEEKDETAK